MSDDFVALNVLAISNDEIAALSPLGKTVRCWICGSDHDVDPPAVARSADGTEEPSVLAFMTCGEKTYLCGIKGKEWRPSGK